MYKLLVISIDELWLKGKNRPAYFRAIKKHAVDVLSYYQDEMIPIKNEEQRLICTSEKGFTQEAIMALQKVPGLHSIQPSRAVDLDLEKIIDEVDLELASMNEVPRTFKVITKRTNKRFPQNSMEISRYIGHLILKKLPKYKLEVDVHKPRLIVSLKVSDQHIYIATKTYPGIGGQPFNTSGHLITLLSGGFDSPVASFLMNKRGCRQTYLFFYAYPYVGQNVLDKILKLVGVLGQYQNGSKLYVLPFGEFQKELSDHIRPDYRTLFFRKYMLEAASLLKNRLKADAIITGDVLSQVSSQTIGNLAIVDQLTPAMVLRPLIGFNKSEIIEISRKIRTHDISTIPHDDACAMFAPKHPVLRPDPEYFLSFVKENQVKYEGLLNQVLDHALIYQISIDGKINKLD